MGCYPSVDVSKLWCCVSVTERSTCCTRDRAPSVREVDKWERVREWQRVCDLDKLMASHVTAPSLRWRLVPTQRWLPST